MKVIGLEILPIELRLFSEEENSFFQLLDPSEKKRAESFRFERDRIRFILSHGLLRFFLSDYLQISPDEITYCYGPQGKPFLASGEIYFNMSHSQEMAFYGFSLSPDFGVDIEYMRPLEEWPFFSFTSEERLEIVSLPEERRKEAFYRTWTKREAYLKAIGCGLSGVEKRELPEDWTYETEFMNGYAATAAYRGSFEKIAFEHPILKTRAARSIEMPPT